MANDRTRHPMKEQPLDEQPLAGEPSGASPLVVRSENRRPGELVFALIILVFSVAAFWQSYEISGFAGKTTPGVFPMLASGTLVVSGLLILLSAIKAPAPDTSNDSVAKQFFREVFSLHHIVLIALVLGYLFLMPWLGFVASSGLFLLIAFQFLWRKNVFVTLLLTAVSLATIYVIFREVFQVVLPQGTLLRGLF